MGLEELRHRLALIQGKLAALGVEELLVFGSTARGTATNESDLDLVVRFKGETTADRYFGLLFLLEDELGRQVDLAERETLHPFVRDAALAGAVRVA